MIIKVTDMTCNNCYNTIQRALLTKGIVSSINLEKREVTLANKEQYGDAVKAIEEAGYTVEKWFALLAVCIAALN